MKRAVAEMLVLAMLNREDMYAHQISQNLYEGSGNRLNIVPPYMLLYRLMENNYVQDLHKSTAPDGRRRQYYQITDKGKEHLEGLLEVYQRFTGGVDVLLQGGKKIKWIKPQNVI